MKKRRRIHNSLLSIGTIFVASFSILTIVSCKNKTDNNLISQSDKDKSFNILRASLIKEDVLQGKNNSKNYNANLLEYTNLFAPRIKYLEVGAKVPGKLGTLKEEWEKILGGKGLNRVQSQVKWDNFIDELVKIGPYQNKRKIKKRSDRRWHKVFSVPENQKDRQEWATIQKENFFIDFWDDSLPESAGKGDLQQKNHKKKYGTVFPSHYKEGVARFAWSQVLLDAETNNWTMAQKKLEIYTFIWDFNEFLNRRNFTYPAVTGKGLGIDHFTDNWLRRIKFDHFIKSYVVKPKGDQSPFQNADGSYKTYKNPKMKKMIKDFLDDITTNIWYEGQQEYDDWYGYEARMPELVLKYCKILIVSDLKNNIQTWLKPYNWFAPNPLYQHATPGAIYNSVPAIKTLNTGANLAHYVETSLKADLIMGDFQKAKRDLQLLSDHIWSNYTSTFNDGFKRDGGYIQHNVMPYQGSYGQENYKYIRNIMEMVEGTELDLFQNYPSMQNIFRQFIKTFIPLWFYGEMTETTSGRMLTSARDEVRMVGIKAISYMIDLIKYSTNDKTTNIIKTFLREQLDLMGDLGDYLKNKIKANEKIVGGNIPSYKLIDDGDGIKQIWSNDMILVNYYNKNNSPDWQFATRFNDTRVGQYEAILGENLQGMYMGDGMQLLKTSKNPHIYDHNFWSGVDAYNLPGVVSYRPGPIYNPDDGQIHKLGDEMRVENEWVNGKSSSWVQKITLAKSDAAGSGFSGGTKMGSYTASMTKMTSWDSKVTHERSVFTIGDRIFVMGYVNNPSKGVALTIDNRLTSGNTGNYLNSPMVNDEQVWMFHDSKTNEKIGYITYDKTQAMKDNVLTYGTSSIDKHRPFTIARAAIKKAIMKELIKNQSYTAPTGEKIATVVGSFNRLHVDLSQKHKFAYEIIPNVDSMEDLKRRKNKIQIKVVRNDQYAHAIEITNEKGEQYLMVNNFSNNNFSTELNFFDKVNPVRLGSTRPVSMIFKKIKGTSKYEATIGDAMHDGLPTRVSFGKAIKEKTFNIKWFEMTKLEDNPQYWTEKENNFQNGKYVDDRNMIMSDWEAKYNPARVELAKYSLYKLGEYFYRRDQIDFIPNKKYHYGKPAKFNFEFV